MHRSTAAGLVLAVTLASLSAVAQPAGMDGYLWSNRLLLVFAPGPDHPILSAQRRVLSDRSAGIEDRDMVVIEVVRDRVTVNGVPATELRADALRSLYGVGIGDAAALLVGKDGGVKIRETDALSAGFLFRTIDAMPMRQREMRENR